MWPFTPVTWKWYNLEETTRSFVLKLALAAWGQNKSFQKLKKKDQQLLLPVGLNGLSLAISLGMEPKVRLAAVPRAWQKVFQTGEETIPSGVNAIVAENVKHLEIGIL